MALRAKIETSVNWANSCSTANVLMIENTPTASGKQGGNDRAEHPHEQDERDRDGDHLSELQILLDRVGDLGVDDSEAAGADGDGVATDARLLEGVDELVGAFDRLRVVTLDVGHHQGVVAAAAAQRRRIAERPVRHGEVDVFEAGDELGDLGPRGSRLVAVDVTVGGGHDQHDVRFDLAERVFEHFLGANRLGTGWLEPAGDQVAGDAAAEHGRGDHQQQAGRPG